MGMRRWLARQARWLLPAVGIVLVSASCGVRSAATASTKPSASAVLIFGVVEVSPGCSVVRQLHPCGALLLGHVRVEARPLPAGVTVTASTRTRGDGHYSVRLGRGRYVLVAVWGRGLARCSPVLVSVTSLAPVRANIHCDSGIR
jgi:hypothetical protein